MAIKGERGQFTVQKDELNRDGSVHLYGGDLNPNGIRHFRDVMPGRLAIDKRKPQKGS